MNNKKELRRQQKIFRKVLADVNSTVSIYEYSRDIKRLYKDTYGNKDINRYYRVSKGNSRKANLHHKKISSKIHLGY